MIDKDDFEGIRSMQQCSPRIIPIVYGLLGSEFSTPDRTMVGGDVGTPNFKDNPVAKLYTLPEDINEYEGGSRLD